MEKIVLFDNKINCCGCGACVNVCPQKAIDMKEDECGFLYPRVDKKKCVGCKLCKKVCCSE
jgi:formate hydrogenlyase subunit 6/NADH:ubiquinone oxidoreductase subunit I